MKFKNVVGVDVLDGTTSWNSLGGVELEESAAIDINTMWAQSNERNGFHLDRVAGAWVGDLSVVDNWNGVVVEYSDSIVLPYVRAWSNDLAGLRADKSHQVWLNNVFVTNNGTYGIRADGCVDLQVVDARAVNHSSQWPNVYVGRSSNVSLVDLTLFGGAGDGLAIYRSGNVLVDGLTSSDHGADLYDHGVDLYNAEKTTLVNVVSSRGTDGIELGDVTTFTKLIDIAVLDNIRYGLSEPSGWDNSVEGLLVIGSNTRTDCNTSNLGGCGSWDVLVTDQTAWGSFVGNAASDATNYFDVNGQMNFNRFANWVDFDNQYRGWSEEVLPQKKWTFEGIQDLPVEFSQDPHIPWYIDETISRDNSDGTYAIRVDLTVQNDESCVVLTSTVPDGHLMTSVFVIGDEGDILKAAIDSVPKTEVAATPVGAWFEWELEEVEAGEHEFRFCLEKLSSDQVNTWVAIDEVLFQQHTTCVNDEQCQLLDFSLVEADSVLRSRFPQPTADDVLDHEWGECTDPKQTYPLGCAAVGETWGVASTTAFLRYSRELMLDERGDDDGLCEEDEACLFTPNLGSYQGHGELEYVGNLGAGLVSGVDLYQYLENGY
ncbi:MAG: hypothetical protein HN348_24955 [Proteobacteria bacterium]|nr:hypothetical protein [Pseudomonadota bacterium]